MGKQRYVIIVAGGSGKRMNSEIPKQFLNVCGKPILMHTIQRFYDFDSSAKFVIVLPESHIAMWNELISKYKFTIPHNIAKGGKERFFSVANALEYVANNSIVAVHDGVRPLVSVETIQRCFTEAEVSGAAIPVYNVNESLRKVLPNKNISVNRSEYRLVQTPQVFLSKLILKSYNKEYNSKFTDDASVVESAGHSVALVAGNVENIKITTPMDLLIAETLLK